MDSISLSLPSSSSTSLTNRWKYDVFLSFRGEDTRYKFTDHLYTALVQRGIVTFRDDEKLERGKLISPELLQVIEESRFAIVILSENYASSTWCLDELAQIIDYKKALGITVLPVFHYVEPSDVRGQKRTFEQAFVAHEEHFKEKIESVEKWRDALRQVGELAGWHLKNESESQTIQSIVGLISRNLRYEFKELTEDLVGIDAQVVELETFLGVGLDDVRFVGVWAMGGMGKTTLVRIVYCMVSENFEASFFVNVREVCEKDCLLSLQKKLLSQILKETNLNIDNIDDGALMIRNRLRYKRILLVLDDVNHSKQLYMLARKPNWFGPGSRIIITTREKDLLEEHSVHKIYEVKPLNEEYACHLFGLKAFKKEHIPGEYLELSKEILKYLDGLPLALEVLGSFLFGKNIDEWKSAFERLKEDPNKEIIQVLQISFDGLCHYTTKEIFLHIACFFNHENKDYIVKILDSLGLFPIIGLKELTDKSLLKIYDDKLWMHNLLGEMGRNIVHQESPNEPRKRSKLWLYKDIDYVLKNNMGSEVVQAIDIKGAIDTRGIYYEEKETRWRLRGSALLVTNVLGKEAIWNLDVFLKMPNLKFLRIRNINLLHVPKYLPNNLRFIEWGDYPSKSLPFSHLDELVQLRLQRSKIELLWEGMKNFDKLKSINLAGSSNLIITPDFIGVPNLEELVLAWCSNLRQLHPSIKNLKKIILLDLKHCKELSCLPDKFEMESLKTLDLICSSKVKKIPEFLGNMKHLEELFLECTAIMELPPSIKCLTGLYFLNLRDCKNLVCLPNTICSLTSLTCLDLFGCSKFDKLPEDLGNMVSLRRLVLGGTAIKELPLSVEFLIGLISLDLTDCKNFVFLPTSICSLKSLFRICLSGCSNFINLPENLGNLEGLKELSLKGTAIEVLPSSIGSLTTLSSLELTDCKNFVCLPTTICSLKSLFKICLFGCSNFVNLPENLGNLEGLKKLSLKGTAIEVLPPSIGSLTALSSLDLSDCKNLLCLPSTICSLKKVEALYLSRCSKIVNLPENLGNMESLMSLCLSGTAIKELPSSTTHLKRLTGVYFSECQWPSSSFNSGTLFRVLSCLSIEYLDLSDCHLSAMSSDINGPYAFYL